MQKYILTYSKTKFYPLDPIMDDIKIIDIAHALSMMARANGHFKHFYSVAQHSINCSLEAKERGYSERVQLGCLLHDASEAYIADITRPVKSELREYLTIEDRLQKIIFERFGIGDITERELRQINEADDALLYFEFKELMDEELLMEKPHLKANHNFNERSFREIREEFILKFNELAANFNK